MKNRLETSSFAAIPNRLSSLIFLLGIIGFLHVLAPRTMAQEKPCCSITSIDTRSGLVSAKVDTTGQAFQFRLNKGGGVGTLKVGERVFANFTTHQVSLDGKTICCTIVVPSPVSPGGTPQAAPIPPSSGANPACCAIVSINAPARIATAKEISTGNTFEFAVPSSIPIQKLRVGESVWANFKARKVSLDGQTACCDLTTVGTTANAGVPSTVQVPQSAPAQNAPASSAPIAAISNAKISSPYKIQTFGVFTGPVPGGQNNAGAVMLTAPVGTTPAVIELSTDNPEVATVPATVKISTGNMASVVVTTFGVKDPVDVTLKAQLQGGSDVFTSRMTVRPAQLSILDCSPNQLPSGSPIHCKLWLDGKTPLQLMGGSPQSRAQGIQVQISTDKPALVSPQTVTLGSGTDKTEFNLPTAADAQGGPITVSASYVGMTKSSTVQLTQALIKDFGCFVGDTVLSASIQGATACTITPWSQPPYGLIVHLTQGRAQEVGIQVMEPGRLHHASSGAPKIVIPASQPWGGVWYEGGTLAASYFEPVPKTEIHTVFVQDPVSGVKHSVTFTVLPAAMVRIGFGDAADSAPNPATVTSLLGQKLKVLVFFNAQIASTDWQSKNAWLDIQYGESTDSSHGNVALQGPTNPAIPAQVCYSYVAAPLNSVIGCDQNYVTYGSVNYWGFEITVGACSIAENPNGCQATVKVSSNQALGSQVGILNVVPQ